MDLEPKLRACTGSVGLSEDKTLRPRKSCLTHRGEWVTWVLPLPKRKVLTRVFGVCRSKTPRTLVADPEPRLRVCAKSLGLSEDKTS